jgi:phospholipase/carboxylesterase
MNVVELGGMRAVKIVKTDGTTPESDGHGPLTIVLMHGYGAPGDDLVSLAAVIQAPAGSTFLFPEAPSMLGFGDARAWWEIDVGRFQRAMMMGTLDEVMKDVPEGMASACESIARMLDAIDPKGRIVLGGFSQGSMLAMDVALRTKRSLAGLVVLSGTLLARDEWLPRMPERKGLPVFQSHGTEDPLLPFMIAEGLRDAMKDAGLDVTFTKFRGGHGIGPEVIRDLNAWLRKLA